MEKWYLKSVIKLCYIFLFILISNGCKKNTGNEESNSPATTYKLQVPQGFPAPYLSEKNPLTYEGIELGRNLYSDPILSTNGRIKAILNTKRIVI